jgi:Flp pilus assembly protein TadD
MPVNPPASFLSPTRSLALFAAAALTLAPVGFASAAGGGGGGGGSFGGGSPSASAPQHDAAAEYRSGLEAYNVGQFEQAAKHFARVVRVAPKTAEAHYLLGASYMRLGNADKARKPLESAVKYAPMMIAAQRDLALTYAQLERPAEAQDVLARLTARGGACGEGCAEKAELDQAIAAIQSAMAGKAQAYAGPDLKQFADARAADALYYQAVAQINEGRYEAALQTLDRAALVLGAHPDILTYQGFANRKLARFAVAEGYYTRALALAPNHVGALEYYGELKVERGDLAGARVHLAKLERLCRFGCYEAEELRAWIGKAS